MTLQIAEIKNVTERPVNPFEVERILNEANMNWEVQMEPLKLPDDTPTGIFGAVRQDTRHTFAAFTKQYHPIQNAELVEMALQISDLTGASVENIRSVDNGGITWITLTGREFPIQYREVGDVIAEKLIISNSHNGKESCRVAFGHLVLSCTNGMTRFDKKASVTVRHTKSSLGRLKNALKGLQKVAQTSEKMFLDYRRMLDVPVGEQHIKQVIELVTGVNPDAPEDQIHTRSANLVKSLWDSISTEMSYKGQNAYGLFNGVTHFTSRRAENGDNPEKGLKSKFFGLDAKKDQTVWEMLSRI